MSHFQSADRQVTVQGDRIVIVRDAAARAEAAAAAQEAAAAARTQGEEARHEAQMRRDMARMERDVARMQREFTPVVGMPRGHGPTPQQERMLFSGFVIAVIAAVIIFYPIMRALGRRLERGGPQRDAVDAGSSERLQRIEHAVDSMAIEIERISEGQRFTTRLLTARADAPIESGR